MTILNKEDTKLLDNIYKKYGHLDNKELNHLRVGLIHLMNIQDYQLRSFLNQKFSRLTQDMLRVLAEGIALLMLERKKLHVNEDNEICVGFKKTY